MISEADLLSVCEKILRKYNLCDSCLGRQFAMLGYGITNKERGSFIKNCLVLEAHRKYINGDDKALDLLVRLAESGNLNALKVLKKIKSEIEVEKKKCYICNGILENLDKITNEVLNVLNKSDYEFDTFVVGNSLPLSILAREDEVKSEFKLEFGESIKREINREVGKVIQQVTNKKFDPTNPDILILLIFNEKDLAEVKIEPNPLFIYGRYRKLVRGIPQNKWIIIRSNGTKVRKYPDSIEEYIAIPILRATGGTDYKFHGAGREDVDARMLGTGRPFVVEIKKPKRRHLDLKKLEEEINKFSKGKVEVFNLRYADRKTVREIKKLAEFSIKTYRALVRLGRKISDDDIKRIEEVFQNITINQRTPLRVLHRRVDKVRKKKVYSIKARKIDDHRMELIIRCQGGLYVKELIHGDKGRTTPSIAEVLSTDAVCEELDVIGIEDIKVEKGSK